MAASQPTHPPRVEKQALRAAMLARRAGEDAGAAGGSLVEPLLVHVPSGVAVAGFWPLPGEIDLRPTLLALHARGNIVLLPEIAAPGEALLFRRWHPGASMLPGRFGTSHPDGGEETPVLLLVPLLAFDRAGGRLGYGGGYYDRTLAALPGRHAVGVAFACQEVPAVPTGPHDMRLDAVATERGLIVCAA